MSILLFEYQNSNKYLSESNICYSPNYNDDDINIDYNDTDLI